ncbi:MAG: hydantoinase/oxoprolinase family protein [Deltaproteobacteria bacterium]|jgi:N-methylhydantoinase A/oxoprolinase/acetone carboxylase beta subunit|nr:hydantoinase/oxoprolinase family protein [Deltaproteobacteria bacterium]
MYLGVDVGGTHTDAVLLDGSLGLRAAAKVHTGADLVATLREVLAEVLAGADAAGVERLTVSTTLGLNSLLTGTADPVGLIVTGGPGLALDPSCLGACGVRILTAAQDHRGAEIAPLGAGEAGEAARGLAREGARALVCGSKFGPKNPGIEESVRAEAEAAFRGPVIAASSLFGGLNLPRRLASAVLNASVLRLYGDFLGQLEEAVRSLGLAARVLVLKSDGGVMTAGEARRVPAAALAAGPAASLLGLWSLDRGRDGDVLMADVGGTSTDLAVLSRGKPLLAPQGLRIAGRETLVRGLLTWSLALGGDTDLARGPAGFVPEPRRRGPALALDPEGAAAGRPPTLTDALNVLGRAEVGDPGISRAAFRKLGADPEVLAAEAVAVFLGRLREAADEFTDRVNRQPCYTVSEFLVDWRLAPARAVLLGGPARSLAPLAGDYLGLPVSAPPEASYANALGAALARPTAEAELYADTALETLSIPTLNVRRRIGRDYTLEDAKRDLLEAMAGAGRGAGGGAGPAQDGGAFQFTLAESFNQMGGRGRSGRVIRVKAQEAPGLMG